MLPEVGVKCRSGRNLYPTYRGSSPFHPLTSMRPSPVRATGSRRCCCHHVCIPVGHLVGRTITGQLVKRQRTGAPVPALHTQLPITTKAKLLKFPVLHSQRGPPAMSLWLCQTREQGIRGRRAFISVHCDIVKGATLPRPPMYCADRNRWNHTPNRTVFCNVCVAISYKSNPRS